MGRARVPPSRESSRGGGATSRRFAGCWRGPLPRGEQGIWDCRHSRRRGPRKRHARGNQRGRCCVGREQRGCRGPARESVRGEPLPPEVECSPSPDGVGQSAGLGDDPAVRALHKTGPGVHVEIPASRECRLLNAEVSQGEHRHQVEHTENGTGDKWGRVNLQALARVEIDGGTGVNPQGTAMVGVPAPVLAPVLPRQQQTGPRLPDSQHGEFSARHGEAHRQTGVVKKSCYVGLEKICGPSRTPTLAPARLDADADRAVGEPETESVTNAFRRILRGRDQCTARGPLRGQTRLRPRPCAAGWISCGTGLFSCGRGREPSP